MTLTDGLILLFVGLFVVLFVYRSFSAKDRNVCEKCAYAKSCTDECLPQIKKKSG